MQRSHALCRQVHACTCTVQSNEYYKKTMLPRLKKSVTKCELLIQYISLVLYVVYILVAFAGIMFESDIH